MYVEYILKFVNIDDLTTQVSVCVAGGVALQALYSSVGNKLLFNEPDQVPGWLNARADQNVERPNMKFGSVWFKPNEAETLPRWKPPHQNQE